MAMKNEAEDNGAECKREVMQYRDCQSRNMTFNSDEKKRLMENKWMKVVNIQVIKTVVKGPTAITDEAEVNGVKGKC
jgi:hypothetical protein